MTKDIDKKDPQNVFELHDRIHDYAAYSHARVGLGHTGGHLKTKDWLHFQADYAQAKDAVFSHFNIDHITSLCTDLKLPYMTIQSQANEIMPFLLRPDLGRMIAANDNMHLAETIKTHPEYCHRDLLIVISGGLSPIAIAHQIPEFLPTLIENTQQQHWSLAPIIINPRGRVALGDQLNAYFKAKVVIMLIGERPGLTTADSMGIYLTYNAQPGCTDAMRHCISNIHQRGFSYHHAVKALSQLIHAVLLQKMSGIALNKTLFLTETQSHKEIK